MIKALMQKIIVTANRRYFLLAGLCTSLTSTARADDAVAKAKSYGGSWDGVADVSQAAQAALNSGKKVIDFEHAPARINTGLIVPAGVEARNVNFIGGTPGLDLLRVGSGSSVNGKITGSGAGGSTVERAVSPDGDDVRDVRLNLDVSRLTVGVQIWSRGKSAKPRRWTGDLRFSGMTGGGTNSNGYGLLIAGADDCEFTVTSVDTPRHCVYISNGSKRNKVKLDSMGNSGAPIQLAAYSNQDYVESNRITATVRSMRPTSSSAAYAVNIVGKCRSNEITVTVTDSEMAQGAVLFRALDADTVPYRNAVSVDSKGGYSGPGVVRSDSAYENHVRIRGEGSPRASSGTAVVSVGVYSRIIPKGKYERALYVDEYSWDAKGAPMRGVAAMASYAPVEINAAMANGHRRAQLPATYTSGGGKFTELKSSSEGAAPLR
ncbi:hypothetical protein [Variovorax paradoxus]|nr:hypothetical protein [Variovorax paradoxus]